MKPGDRVIIYHTGGVKAVVGLAEVASVARPDPNDDRSWVTDFKYVAHAKKPVTLKEIKDSHKFDDWALVRMGRLSTMQAPDAFWSWLQEQGAFSWVHPLWRRDLQEPPCASRSSWIPPQMKRPRASARSFAPPYGSRPYSVGRTLTRSAPSVPSPLVSTPFTVSVVHPPPP
jgi:hypothetical protein